MHFRPQQLAERLKQMAPGFVNLGYYISFMIYPVYFGVMFGASKKISAITGWSWGLILLTPVAACHFAACLWLLLHLLWCKKLDPGDTPGQVIYSIGSSLLTLFTVVMSLLAIILKIENWIDWLH